MNEWIIVGGVAVGTILLLGGWGTVAAIARGGRKKRDD